MEPRRMRVECHLAASVGSPDRERFMGWVRNMSAGGMFVATAGRLPVGTRCDVALLLREGDAERTAHAVGEVVRVADDGLALQLLAMHPDAERAVRRMLQEVPPAPVSG